MNPLIPSLVKPKSQKFAKMSASDNSGKIDFDDTDEILRTKIKQAYSLDGFSSGNGLLTMLKYVLFRWLESKGRVFEVSRSEEYGGNQTFVTYNEVEHAFALGLLVSADLKPAISSLLIEFLAPLRHICELNSDLLNAAYPSSSEK